MALAGTAWAQQPATAASSDIDPGAVAALDKMGAYLRTIKTFRVTAKTTRDKVLDNGLLVQRDGKADILAQFPSHLRIDTVNGEKQRLYLYDGKDFTLYGKVIQYYATVAAPSTIGQLAAVLADKYDIELPLEDLFWSGNRESELERPRGGGGRRPERCSGHHLRALRVSPGRSGLADLDSARRQPAAAQARHHDDDRRGAAADTRPSTRGISRRRLTRRLSLSSPPAEAKRIVFANATGSAGGN